MRIPSGKTDIYLYFVAVDATDLVTRETGLSSFTVQRSRNGAAEVAYTTPTITEIDATNCPGVYALLIDEDTTLASTSDSEECMVHITATGMAPVTRTFELYRRTATTGRTLAVDSNSRIDVGAVLGTAQTAGDLAAMITAVDDFVDTEIATIITNIATLQTSVNTVDDFIDTEVAAIFNRIGAPVGASISADIAAVKTDTASIITKVDTVDDFLDTEIAAIKAKTDNLPSDPADASDIAASFVTVNSTLSTIAGYVDTEVAAIKAKTDNLPASPAATSDIPTANANADALLDRANGVETGFTLRQTIRLMSAVLAGKSSGHPGSPVYRNMGDTADRVTATVSSGNRSAVTLNP